jgi:protein-tyrosine kinase
MSIVERAIKKLQESGPAARRHEAAPPVREPVFGTVVTREAPPASAQAPQTAFQPQKHIEISRDALRAAGLLPPEHQARQIADEYRQIKRPLIANAFGRGQQALPRGRIIAMMSALPGEGKTFNSINLAFSMALEKDMSVLLVDADVAKPHISRMFGVRDEPGLIDLLTDPHRTLEEVILATNIPGLSILPAGRTSETATELLASTRMTEIVQGLERQDPNRIVLFDSPPLLLTTESRALAASAGQVVLVVRADETPRNAVLEAVELIGEGKWVGLILNQSSTPSAGGYYGYGQRYGEVPREEAATGT